MKLLTQTSFTALALFGAISVAQAGGYRSGIELACDNGRTYTLQPRATTIVGEVVTGRLWTGKRRAAKVRLIPMGNGYRYAGRGIWLDGIRGDAVLHLGKYATTGCQRVG